MLCQISVAVLADIATASGRSRPTCLRLRSVAQSSTVSCNTALLTTSFRATGRMTIPRVDEWISSNPSLHSLCVHVGIYPIKRPTIRCMSYVTLFIRSTPQSSLTQPALNLFNMDRSLACALGSPAQIAVRPPAQNSISN